MSAIQNISNRKLHVLIISSWYPTSNSTAGIFVEMQADALVKAGCRVTILLHNYYSLLQYLKPTTRKNIYSKKTDADILEINSVFIFPFRIFSNPEKYQKKWIEIFIVLRLRLYSIFKGKPTIIHHHGILNNVYLSGFIAKYFKVPYVLTEHSPIEETENIKLHNPFDNIYSVKRFVRDAQERVAVSAFFSKKYQQIFGADYTVIPNLVSDFFIQPINYYTNASVFYFLSIGNLEAIKNHKLLIQAFAKAFNGNEKIKLKIVGTGSLITSLKNEVEKQQIALQVEFAGYLSRDEIKEVIYNSACLVVSSIKESFGVVLIEALFGGLPLISTKCGGPESIINESNGYLTENNDVEDLANKLQLMFNNYKMFNREKIKEDAIAKYSENIVSKELIQLYNRVLNK